ncbi:MAG: hypothetical protein KTR16_03645 [Acidiferrobacterales bacterium]|nr:hypothetical protein [Acidiferrobacterales bacterium]
MTEQRRFFPRTSLLLLFRLNVSLVCAQATFSDDVQSYDGSATNIQCGDFDKEVAYKTLR